MRIKRWTGSLVVRTSVFLLLVIILAQVLSGIIWYQHASERDKEGLTTTVKSLALSASSTIAFFQTLPSEYRHLVLNQLRNMGGTRFSSHSTTTRLTSTRCQKANAKRWSSTKFARY